MTDAAPSPPPHAQVLLINHYHCRKCHTSFSAPNPRLLYRFDRTPRTRGLSVNGSGYYGIPHETLHGPSQPVDSCENCFKTYSANGQIELFPELICPPPPPAGWGKPKEPSKAEGKSTPLSDF